MADERVTPGVTDVQNLQKHIVRYNLALMLCDNKEVLDLSCGTGYGTRMLAMVAKQVIGIDISKEAITHAKTYYKTHNTIFEEKDILELEYKPVDTVVSFETIEHFEDLAQIEQKLSDHIKPGGSIIYSVPLYESYHNEYHHHTFDLKKGLELFKDFENTSYLIQKGFNFLAVDPEEPFTYLIATKTKPFK